MENKEKQIIERHTAIIELTTLLCGKPCELCKFYMMRQVCMPEYIARKIYDAGYRKQSEGEWVVTDADSGSFGEYAPFIEFKCPKCGAGYGIESGQYGWEYGEPIPWVACPLCGEKMKGGK